MNLWVWSRSLDFKLGFPLQGFCVLYFALSELLAKHVLECIVNPTYLIGCCDFTRINLVLKTILLIFNKTHNVGCCEYWYWLGGYNLWRVKSGSLNYPFLECQFMVGIIQPTCFFSFLPFFRERYGTTTTFILSLVFLFCFLNFVFDIYIIWFLRSNKTWLSERFSLLSRYEWVLLEHFYSISKFLYFYLITNFESHYHHYYYHHYHCYCCSYHIFHCHCHYYFFIFNAFNFC